MKTQAKLAAMAVVAAAVPGMAAETPAPTTTYWMSAETTSGQFGGAGAPSAGSIMRGMMGGGSTVNHNLTLQLGSPRRPTGAPEAEHLPPAGLRAGASLPLVTPRIDPAREVPDEPPLPYQKPKGKMLIFWGCGDHASPGQPLTVDFSKPASLTSLGTTDIRFMRPPSPARATTYGDWPNGKSRKTVPGDGSLVGDHTVRGNYSPEIRFALGPNQDFLAPLNVNNTSLPSGATRLAWNSIPNARAYFASVMGGGGGDDGQTVVLWTSSATRLSFGVFGDYLAPEEITRQLSLKTLLSPQTTTCTVPAEVTQAAPAAMLSMTAWGGEANFAYPPRPADPKIAWKPEWVAKVRYKSTSGSMLGMSMSGMAAASEGGPPPRNGQNPNQPPARPDKKSVAKGLLKGITGF